MKNTLFYNSKITKTAPRQIVPIGRQQLNENFGKSILSF